LKQQTAQLAGTPLMGAEMDGQTPLVGKLSSSSVFEMPAREPVGSEMESPGLKEVSTSGIGDRTGASRLPMKRTGVGLQVERILS
jgi:hypothetical protein